jgi:hypothetical protein
MGLLGFICISIAVERLFILEDTNRKLDRAMDRLEDVLQAELIVGKVKIYETAIELTRDAEDFIRATSFGERESSSEKYLKSLADKLKESKNRKRPIEYRLVVSHGKDIESRMQLFRQKGVDDLVKPRHVDVSWEGWPYLKIDKKGLNGER